MNQNALPIVLKAFEAVMKRDFPTFTALLTPDCFISKTYRS